MPRGLIFSVFLHISLLLLFLFGIPLPKKEIDNQYAITIEMVNISELSNLKNMSKSPPLKKPLEEVKTLPPSASQPLVAQKTPEPIAPPKPSPKAHNPIEDAEAIPEKKKEEKTKEEKTPPEPPKPVPPKPKPEVKKTKEDDFNKTILKTLNQSTSAVTPEKKKIEKKSEDQPDKIKAETNRDYKSDKPLSLSEQDKIRAEITKNWNTSAFSGAENSKMQVSISVDLDPMANVLSVKPKRTIQSGASYNAFVESVVRAIKKTDFSSILTPENYGSWHELEFNFDSSGMIY